MSVLSSIRTVLDFLFRRQRAKRDMEEELRSHLQRRADDLERQGISRAEAERQARIEFGGYERYKEECREALGTRLLGELLADLRCEASASLLKLERRVMVRSVCRPTWPRGQADDDPKDSLIWWDTGGSPPPVCAVA